MDFATQVETDGLAGDDDDNDPVSNEEPSLMFAEMSDFLSYLTYHVLCNSVLSAFCLYSIRIAIFWQSQFMF